MIKYSFIIPTYNNAKLLKMMTVRNAIHTVLFPESTKSTSFIISILKDVKIQAVPEPEIKGSRRLRDRLLYS